MAIAWGSVLRLHPPLAAAPTRRRILVPARNPRTAESFAPGVWSLTTAAAFHGLEDHWRELSAETRRPSPFHSWEFAAEWFEHFVRRPAGGATGRFSVLVAADGRGRLIGIAPMFEERARGRGGLGLVLQPFGHAHSIENMTDEPMVLLRRQAEDRARAMFVGSLASQAGRAGWDVATVAHGSGETPARPLFSLPPTLQYVELTRLAGGSPELRLPASFAAFRAGLSKSMRDNLAYYPRRLQRERGDWCVRFAREPLEVAEAARELIDLHRERSRWSEGLPHASHIPSEREASFLSTTLRRLAARRQVNVARLLVRGQTVAAQAFLERGREISVYYSGQAEAWRRYSPLTVIMSEVIRDAIERRIERLVFPRGAGAWKTRWGATLGAPVPETSIYSTAPGALARGVLRRLHAAAAV